jgi:hypothetical protein
MFNLLYTLIQDIELNRIKTRNLFLNLSVKMITRMCIVSL